jgi:hypothetical protein
MRTIMKGIIGPALALAFVVAAPGAARAELLHAEIKTLGMD